MYYFGLKSHSKEIKSKPQRIFFKHFNPENYLTKLAPLATFSGVKTRLVKIQHVYEMQ